jgi:hypothetical protein
MNERTNIYSIYVFRVFKSFVILNENEFLIQKKIYG